MIQEIGEAGSKGAYKHTECYHCSQAMFNLITAPCRNEAKWVWLKLVAIVYMYKGIILHQNEFVCNTTLLQQIYLSSTKNSHFLFLQVDWLFWSSYKTPLPKKLTLQNKHIYWTEA